MDRCWCCVVLVRSAVQVIELSEKGLSTKVIALANAAWIRYMVGRMPETGEAILGVSSSVFGLIKTPIAGFRLPLEISEHRYYIEAYRNTKTDKSKWTR